MVSVWKATGDIALYTNREFFKYVTNVEGCKKSTLVVVTVIH